MNDQEEYTEYGYRGLEELKKAHEEIKELKKELEELRKLLEKTNENKRRT